MTISRYDDREVRINDHEQYKKFFEGRNINFIKQYTTPSLRDFSQKEVNSLTIINHVWSSGDKFWKLSYQFYDKSELWWIIAWFNKVPTESHIQIGDTIYIPTPLDKVLEYLEEG